MLDAAKSTAATASNLMIPDTAKISAMTGWLRTRALAEAQDMPLSGHLPPELSLQLLAATPRAHRRGDAAMMASILQTQLETRDGAVVMHERSGFGLEWHERTAARCHASPLAKCVSDAPRTRCSCLHVIGRLVFTGVAT